MMKQVIKNTLILWFLLAFILTCHDKEIHEHFMCVLNKSKNYKDEKEYEKHICISTTKDKNGK